MEHEILGHWETDKSPRTTSRWSRATASSCSRVRARRRSFSCCGRPDAPGGGL